MNYLAHVFLADNDPQLMLGNLMADVLKRSDFSKWPPRVQRGVLQHRQVDAYTDRHPAILRSIRRLPPAWGWFGGIIIDVHCDFLLTEAWPQFSRESLRSFCDRISDYLRLQLEDMPEEARLLATRLIDHDRLFSYSTTEGIAFALERVSERILERMPKLQVRLQDSLPELLKLHDPLMDDFQEFFPRLIEFSDSWKAKSELAAAIK